MRYKSAVLLVFVGSSAVQPRDAMRDAVRVAAPPVTAPNPNTTSAGTLRNGEYVLELDAVAARWHDGAGAEPGSTVLAFAERDKSPTVPGPLARVPAGTNVRLRVRNKLATSIKFFLPISPVLHDSIVIAPGATEELSLRDAKPGNYHYRAVDGTRSARLMRIAGALGGALVVDTVGAPQKPNDRVLMIMMTPDSESVAGQEADTTRAAVNARFAFTINGRSWPGTERFNMTVGDTLHWRVINGSFDVHPMHLHGFYYRVDEFTGPLVARDGPIEPGRMVVTQRMSPYSAMSITWGPERPGNWLMHCHLSLHLVPPGDVVARTGHENHALTEMVGLVVGITVKPRSGDRAVAAPKVPRKMHIYVMPSPNISANNPVQRFVIEENGRRTTSQSGMSPTLYLTRNEPVEITVVNQLHEHTAVHWHGMELESYYDGVAGLSGAGTRIAPLIAPSDSFVARFTPPRAGTFMYHSHVDDIRQQRAGLVGAMIVKDGPAAKAPDDYEIFMKAAVAGTVAANEMEINGVRTPDTLVIRAGRPARIRVMSLAISHVNVSAVLTARLDSVGGPVRDTLVAQWVPVAKDGADLPPSLRRPVLARQIMSMGETYDFMFTPPAAGTRLQLEMRGTAGIGVLFARVPIRVE